MKEKFVVSAGPDYGRNAEALLEKIEECRKAGGGEIYVTDGVYAVASIRLYSDMVLHLASGAVLKASSRWEDYTDFHVPSTIEYIKSERVIKMWHLPPHYFNAVITAVEAENVAVVGEPGAVIDGSSCFDPAGEESFRGPMGMVFCRCRNVTLQGYTFVDASNWAHQLDSCRNVDIHDVTVRAGHDGFNVHHCENVRIDHCDIRTGDDCVAGYDARNVYVANCYMNTSCNGFRFGGENLVVENCTMEGPGEHPHLVSGRHNMLFAFEYYSLPEDTIRENSTNWLIRGCSFRNMDGLIHYDFGDEKEHQLNRPLEQVIFDGFEISKMKKSSTFCGGGRCPAEIHFRNGCIDMDGMETDHFLLVDQNTAVHQLNCNVNGDMIKIRDIHDIG